MARTIRVTRAASVAVGNWEKTAEQTVLFQRSVKRLLRWIYLAFRVAFRDLVIRSLRPLALCL
jgi:hypothetical protein